MPKKEVKKKLGGRNFALTIILGVFVAIMVVTLFNLLVTYIYEDPQYDDFCHGMGTGEYGPYPIKYGIDTGQCISNCTFSRTLQEETDNCTYQNGIPFYEYNDDGCAIALKECNLCNQNFEKAFKKYNENTFFVYAAIGFILIVLGLFINTLLIQIIMLPAGAFLVIEAAVKNFDNKLYVIIVFSLLIIAAVYLALKKLR